MPRGIGPGSYSLDIPKKLPDCENFLTLAERKTLIQIEHHESIAPGAGAYSPYIPSNSHCSSYVFESASKRGCQVMPPESVGPGSYNLDTSKLHPVSFPTTERDKFDNFKGKSGVGPAHYVNTGKNTSRICSFEYYSDRFFPTDKTGVYVIPEAEEDKPIHIEREKIIINKKFAQPFNTGEERFNKVRDNWVKKKRAPDPGYYQVKEKKELGFFMSKSDRFDKIKNKAPGPGNYDIDLSPLKPVNDSGFLNST